MDNKILYTAKFTHHDLKFHKVWWKSDKRYGSWSGQMDRQTGQFLYNLFGRGHFETIQYALCHHKFSYMINQKFMKLCTLQDPNMKMCTLVVYPGPSSFPRIMSLKVVFQICFVSTKMMGTQGY
jgi:hypothetical protein